MTLTTIGIIWLVSGIISAIWHIVDEWWHHKIFENNKNDIFLETVIMVIIALIAGPIGLAIKIWEKWLDPSNV
jgi:hypothetical protein